MRLRSTIMTFLLMAFIAVPPAIAEVQISARVDRAAISSGESLRLEVTVRNGSGEVDISAITDFNVLSRGTASGIRIINGKMTKEKTYTYLLMPLRKGDLTIPALKVVVDGKTHRTDPITVSVKDRPEENVIAPAGDKDVWISADLSETSPFQGQQITYTFRLYNAVQIDEAKFQPPEFEGFAVEEIKDRRSYRKIINGRDHMVTEVYFILTPLETGPHTLDPAVLHVGILRYDRSRRRSPFDDYFNRGTVENRVLQTTPLELTVRALPPLQKDKAFSGLVGTFDMTAEMEAADLEVGDSATLTVTIKGRGNVMDAQNPPLDLPAAFKRYSDNPEEEIQLDRNGYSGKKVFRTALVPVQPGTYPLPAIEVVYFDVVRKAYRTLKAQPPVVTVAASAATEEEPITIAPGSMAPLKKKVAFTGRDILPPKENLAAIQSRDPLGWPVFLLSLLIPALAFAGAMAAQRLSRRDTSPGALMRARARKAIKSAHGLSGGELITALYQALTAAIFAAAGRQGEALTWNEAEALLKNSRIPEQEAARAARLLFEIEALKFSGAGPDDDHCPGLLGETRKIVKKLTS